MSNPFDVIVPEIIFQAVERLGGRCTGRFLALHAMENRVYGVQLEDSTEVVVKFYRPGRWSKEIIKEEHQFLIALEKEEIPVVVPLKDSQGDTLFEIEKIYYVVFPKRAGRLEPELNVEQLQRLGRFLARIHNVGETFKKSKRLTLSIESHAKEPLALLLSKDYFVEPFRSRFQTLVNQLVSLIEPRLNNIPTLLLYGDCHCGNVLWKGNEPFFIDFDDMLKAPAVQDIWLLTGGNDSYGQEMRKTLLEAYEQIRSFDHSTLDLIEPLRTLRMIHYCAWVANRWEDPAFKATFPNFGSANYWQEQIEGLSIQLEKLTN